MLRISNVRNTAGEGAAGRPEAGQASPRLKKLKWQGWVSRITSTRNRQVPQTIVAVSGSC